MHLQSSPIPHVCPPCLLKSANSKCLLKYNGDIKNNPEKCVLEMDGYLPTSTMKITYTPERNYPCNDWFNYNGIAQSLHT